MSPEEKNETIARLIRKHKEIVEKRLYATERVKQIATALKSWRGRLTENRISRKSQRTPFFTSTWTSQGWALS